MFPRKLRELLSVPTRRSRQSRLQTTRKRSPRFLHGFESLEERTVLSFVAPVSYTAGTTPVAMISGDFNGDGRVDLLTTNSGTNNVDVLLGNGDGSFQAPLSSSL